MKDLSSVNMPDPIRKRFGYGQLWPLRPACSQNRTGSYMPDPTSRILFSSVSPKKAWVILCKTDLDPIWMAWPGFGSTHLVWKQAGVQESSGRVSGRTQPARYQFLTFRRGSVLPKISRIIFSSGRSCLVLAKQIRSGSKPVCKTHPARFWPMLSSRADLACLLGSVSESKYQRLLSQYKLSDSELHKFVCFPQYFIQSFYFTTVHLIC